MSTHEWLAAVLVCLLVSGSAAARKDLGVVLASAPPAVDGVLADPCWQGATAVSGFVRTNGEAPTEQTTARITWDAANLYVAFSCSEREPVRLRANAAGSDSDEIFGDDNVELFLDTNCDRATYFHFAINSAAAHYQASCDLTDGSLMRREDWNPRWKVRARVGPRGWSAEMRVPFASLGVAAPAAGTVWGVNFCRSWRRVDPGEFSTWSGAVAFNRPKEFGHAVFGHAPGTAAYREAIRRAVEAAERAARAPKIDLHPDRFYYTPDLERMTVRVVARLEGDGALEVAIRKNVGAGPVASMNVTTADVDGRDLSFAIGDLPRGRYVVSARLDDENGRTLQTAHRIFIKRDLEPVPAPPSALEATVRADGIILLEGKPFLPFVAEGWSPASPLAKGAFNLKTYGDLGTLAVAGALDWPRLNLPWVTRTDEGAVIVMPEKQTMNADIRRQVEARRSDPALLCRLLKYEAHLPMVRGPAAPWTPIDNVRECREINALVKRVDPHHLTSIHVDRPKYLPDYKDVADIVEIAYWSSSYAPRLIPNLSRDLKKVRHVIGPGRAFKFWIGGSVPKPQHRTAEEIRCACYLTLMHGAAAIGFNMGHGGLDPSFTRHWSVYPGLYRELLELFAILTALQDAPVPALTVDAPQIETRVRRRGDRVYLIAVNASKHLVRATVSVPESSLVSTSVELPFEHRTIQPKRNSFEDAFTAFEPHVYELCLGPLTDTDCP